MESDCRCLLGVGIGAVAGGCIDSLQFVGDIAMLLRSYVQVEAGLPLRGEDSHSMRFVAISALLKTVSGNDTGP